MQVQGQKLTRRGALLGTGGGVRVGGGGRRISVN